jgi:hypothetical protein
MDLTEGFGTEILASRQTHIDTLFVDKLALG